MNYRSKALYIIALKTLIVSKANLGKQRIMSRLWAALLAAPVLVYVGGAEAQPSQTSVLMQIRQNFTASTEVCELFSFVAAKPPKRPPAPNTLCAIGGPFGAGMVGTFVDTFTTQGITIQFDRTVTFATGQVYMRGVGQNVATVDLGDAGGVIYFTGTWNITGGTGAFAGLNGQGTSANAAVFTSNHEPPPDYGEGQLVGWVSQ